MEEFDWETALHEAGHAVVGLKLGWDIDWVRACPSLTHFNETGRETVDEAMAMAAAGTLAQLISEGQSWADAFDRPLGEFFERLGDEDVPSQAAKGLVAGSPAEDMGNLTVAIDMHATREEGIARFQEARATAARLLTENWDLVERLGRALQADPSGQSSEVAALLAEGRIIPE